MRRRNRIRTNLTCSTVLTTALLVAGLCLGEASGQDLPGDCDGSGQVSVDEIVTGINVALDMESLEACHAIDENDDGVVSVDELIRSVREALGFIIVTDGDCVRPGPAGLPAPGLVSCASGAPVRLLRCEQRDQCLHDPSAQSLRDEELIDSEGTFSLTANSNEIRGAALIISADVETGQRTYLTMGFGSLGSLGGAAGRAAGVGGPVAPRPSVSPMSDAAVLLIDENGLENYVDAGIPMIIAAVEAASADSNFAGMTAEDAVVLALDNARIDEEVEDELQANRVLVRNVRLIEELSPAGDIDLYGFSLDGPAEILLEATLVQGGIVPCLELRSASDEPLAERQCGLPARLMAELGRGSYQVLISDESGGATGTYGVLVADPTMPTPTGTPEPPTATATVTTPTSTQTPTATSTPTPSASATATPGTFIVDSTDDAADADPGNGACTTARGSCTVRAAIEEANASGLSYFIQIPPGTYTLTSGIRLIVQGQMSLIGAGSSETIIQAADAPSATTFGIFEIPSGVVRLSGMTIRNGRRTNSAGALQVGEDAVVTLTDSILSQNVDAIVNAGRLTIEDCRVEAGGGRDFGDAISNRGTLAVVRTSISPGGGLSAGIVNGGELTFSGSEAHGGLDGIFNELLATATVTDSVLRDNTFGIRNLGVAALERCSIRGNTTLAGDPGAGVTNSGVLTVIDTTVDDNTASYGAGVHNTGMANLRDCTISRNKTSGTGSMGSGGGVWNSGTLEMTNCTISGNQALRGQGGGVMNEAGSLTVRSCTVSANTAGAGGGVAAVSGSLRLANALVAVNSAADGPDCLGAPTSLGYNLIGNAAGCDPTAAEGDLLGSANSPIDPMLGPLQDNGGPTLTHALLFGSPAVDAANPLFPGSGGNACEASDQRAVSRPQGIRCDIGAYEAPVVQP